jgi:hypothetical protein
MGNATFWHYNKISEIVEWSLMNFSKVQQHFNTILPDIKCPLIIDGLLCVIQDGRSVDLLSPFYSSVHIVNYSKIMNALQAICVHGTIMKRIPEEDKRSFITKSWHSLKNSLDLQKIYNKIAEIDTRVSCDRCRDCVHDRNNLDWVYVRILGGIYPYHKIIIDNKLREEVKDYRDRESLKRK